MLRRLPLALLMGALVGCAYVPAEPGVADPCEAEDAREMDAECWPAHREIIGPSGSH